MDTRNPECYPPSQSLRQSLTEEEQRVPEEAETAIMAAVDQAQGDTQFIIADTSRDDAWLSMDADASLTLEAWR